MISFSDVKKYINDSPAVSRFKPWWEICLDLLLAGMFMIMILSWTKSYSVEAGGLLCIPFDGDASGYNTSDIRYIQSRCFMESAVSTIEFYPYVLFLQWCVIFLCQISWIWIPSVIAKIMYFHKIFSEIIEVEPTFVFNPNNYRMLPEIDYTNDNREKLKIIHDKITLMLMDKNNLCKIYRRKVYLLTVVLICFFIVVLLWLVFVRSLNANFSCTLKGGLNKKSSPHVVCNISPQLFIYGILILHVFILLLMIIFSIKGVFWYRKMKIRIRDSSDKLFGEFADNYKGLPGYKDLSLILELFKVNVCDGKYMINTIVYVLMSKYNLRQPIVAKNDQFAIERVKKVPYSFWEEYCVVELMAQEIGVKIKNHEQTSSTLFEYLNSMYRRQYHDSYSADLNIKRAIHDEICSNIVCYSQLAESPACFPPLYPEYDQKSSSYSVINKANKILHDDDWPDHLILLVASNVLKTRFVLLTATTPVEDDFFSLDVFKPFGLHENIKTVILAYISPYYYYTVENQSNADASQQSNRLDYLEKPRYRIRLRQNAARRVGAVRVSLYDPKDVKFRRGRTKTHIVSTEKTTRPSIISLNDFPNSNSIKISEQEADQFPTKNKIL